MTVSVYLSGTGNVGRNLIQLIYNKNLPIRIAGIENRRGQILGNSITLTQYSDFMKNPSDYPIKENPEDLDYDIYVDMRSASKTGTDETNTYVKLFESGKNLVTANKSGLANHWKKINASSIENNRKMFYEATVAGGLPLFSVLRNSLNGFQCSYFQGIVNLTANFVMRMMREGHNFEDACSLAVKEGIGETDMSDDLLGIDSARKAVILSNAIFGQSLSLSDIKYGGMIRNSEKNQMLLVTIRKNEEFYVQSEVVSLEKNHPFLKFGPMAMGYRVGFEDRSILTVSEDYDGPVETAGAVLSDILSLK